MTKRINRKHYMIFNNGGVISVTTPKDWARGNQHCFPDFNFSDSKNTPTVEIIEKYLVEKLRFYQVINENIVINYDYKAL